MSQQLKMVSEKQQIGKVYENMACQFLLDNGLQLIAQNWLQAKIGELDLVMLETGKAWDTLVFVEVRVRKSEQFGDALASITKAKQRKLIKTAHCFLQNNPNYQNYDCRFDVIAFTNNRPTWIQGAFMSDGW